MKYFIAEQGFAGKIREIWKDRIDSAQATINYAAHELTATAEGEEYDGYRDNAAFYRGVAARVSSTPAQTIEEQEYVDFSLGGEAFLRLRCYQGDE